MAFQIIKENTSDIWRHSDTTDPNNDLILSTGFFKFTGDEYELFSESGGSLRTSTLTNIEVIDETDTGTPETFTTALACTTRLNELGYPFFNVASSVGAVLSVFGRVGAVVATVDDYTASQIDNNSIVAGAQVSDALNTLSGQVTGFVSVSGIPVNNQFAVFTDASTIEGISAMTYDTENFIIGDNNSILTIRTNTGYSEIYASNRFDFETNEGIRLNNIGKTAATNIVPSSTGITTLTAPTTTGIIPVTVNGTAADAAGNIAVTLGLGDMILADNQTVTGDKIFEDGSLLLRPSGLSFSLIVTSVTNLTSNNILTLDVDEGDRTLIITDDASIEGTNTGDQTITLTDDVTGTGTSSFATTIAANAVTFPKMTNIATSVILGRVTAGTGNIESLSGTQATTLLDVFTTSLQGVVPASGGLSTEYLSADGTFSVPAGGGGGDMFLANVQTVTGAKTFEDATLLMRNVADTFSSQFTNTNTAARTYTLQDDDGTVAFVSDITGLEALDEGNGNGYRPVGRDANDYANIGLNAVDFTNRFTEPVNTIGALAENSFAIGEDSTAGGYNDIVMAYYSTTDTNIRGQRFVTGGSSDIINSTGGACIGLALLNDSSWGHVVVGTANLSTTGSGDGNRDDPDDPIFTVGNGTYTVPTGRYVRSVPSNAFQVLKGGLLKAPSYGSGTMTGTATYNLSVDVNGDIIETANPAIGGDMILADAQTNTGIKTFEDTTMKLRNVADTFDGYFTNTNTADRIYTLPDTAGTIALTSGTGLPVELSFAISDETTDLTTGVAKLTFRMPHAMTLTEVRASVGTAPTGSTIIFDINESGATILSTKLSIDATEKTSTTAATPPVISDSSLADDAEITIDIDQIGSTIAGAGAKITLIGTR
ncbi:MAG: hypothetical protein GY928_01885 [Colwellia sp.]|nr:hypothetical protein [Colwellia sp.]